MTINTQKLREAAANAKALTAEDLIGFRLTATAHITGLARAIESCCDHIDAQTAEIAKAHSQVERWKKVAESAEDRAQVAADEIERLRGALRWAAGALQEACRRPTIITEKDRWRIDHETRTTGEILAAADAALQEKSND